MKDLLKKYKNKTPEIVFEWSDSETDAKGWVVINSLRNGAAGGGTRMRKGLTKSEVLSLAKVMEIKFTVSGPSIGGAKSGIDFDPTDPRKNEVLKRWYKAVFPLLKSYYGTGGDLNIDELKDVVPITEELGLWHPQEGVVNGRFHFNEGQKIHILGQLRQGCEKIVENPKFVPTGSRKYAVADLITGYGVAESVRHYYELFKKSDLKGKRVIIQGWGNVASAAAIYLGLQGVKIVGIIDKNGGLLNKDGFSFDDIKKYNEEKKGNKLKGDSLIPFEELNDKIWDVGAEIFIPAAASKIVSKTQVDRLLKNGLEVVSCGANVPFVDDEVLYGPTAQYLDQKIGLIPDFIANSGMARVFAYLMEDKVELSDEKIFEDASNCIKNALQNIFNINKKGVSLQQIGLETALKQLVDDK